MLANLLRNACAVRNVGDMETETMETETLLPGQPRTRAEGEAYTAALAAFDEAQAALAAQTTETLLRTAYSLTHRMERLRAELDAGRLTAAERAPLRATERDLRQQRDMIDAEVLRRTDHGYSLRVVR